MAVTIPFPIAIIITAPNSHILLILLIGFSSISSGKSFDWLLFFWGRAMKSSSRLWTGCRFNNFTNPQTADSETPLDVFHERLHALLLHTKTRHCTFYTIPVEILILNDVWVTSPSILPWNCWHVINETHDDVNLQYQPDIRILRLDQSDFNIIMTSSWYQMLSSIKTFSRIVYQVLRTSPADVLKTSLYGLICNSEVHVLPTSWKCPKDVLR